MASGDMTAQSERDLVPTVTTGFPQPRGEGFSAGEMLPCPKCTRRNPPTRAACLYCGAAFAHAGVAVNTSSAISAQTLSSSATLEFWEQGYTVVLLANAAEAFHVGAPPVVGAEVKRLLGIEEDQLRRMIKSGVTLPLVRLKEREQAELIGRRLAALALPVRVLPDAALRCGERDINRVRRLEIKNAKLRVWTRAGIATHEVEDATAILDLAEIVALVRGRIFTREIETSTPHVRGSETYSATDAEAIEVSLLEPPAKQTRELFADDSVLDIYTTRAGETWRIHAGSFDYSCLGARRTLLARDNFELLVEAMRLAASKSHFDDSYTAVRTLLEPAWSLATRTDARGHKRRQLGRFALESATIVSNETQFTAYARTCAHFARERRAATAGEMR